MSNFLAKENEQSDIYLYSYATELDCLEQLLGHGTFYIYTRKGRGWRSLSRGHHARPEEHVM